MQSEKKKPQTLKQRLRSWLWKFLMEEQPRVEFKVDGLKFFQAVQSTIRDNAQEVQKSSSNKHS